MAIAAFVLSLVSLFVLIVLVIPAIVAIVLALVSRKRINRDPAKKGKGLATAALIIGIVAALVGIAVDVGIGIYLSQATTFEDLAPGDCIKAPGDDDSLLRTQSCSGNHEREVFAVFDSSASSFDSYPGRENLASDAQAECTARFPATGTNPPKSDLRPELIVPSRSDWNDGERRIVCLVGREDGRPLSGPIEGVS